MMSLLWRFDLPTYNRPFGAYRVPSTDGTIFWDFDVNVQKNVLLIDSQGDITTFDPANGNTGFGAYV
jgi:hypothetical protein